MNLKDGQAATAGCGDVDTVLSEETKASCRRVVCRWVAGQDLTTTDATELMRALGVHPLQTEDNPLGEPALP